MANELLKFKKGLHANLAKQAKVAGTVYVTTDEQAMYVDIDNSTRIRLSDIIQVDTVNKLRDMAPKYSSTALYYVIDENALLKYTGDGNSNHTWKQINSVSDVTANLDALTTRVTNNEKAITANADGIKKLNKEVYGNEDGTQHATNGLVKKVAALEAADVTIKADVKANKDAIGTTNDAASADGTLYARIKKNASDISGLTTRVGTAESSITTLSSIVGATANDGLRKAVADNTTNISNLRTDLGNKGDSADADGSAFARIAAVKASVATNTGEIANLKTKDQAIDKSISDINGSISTINGEITTIKENATNLAGRVTTAEGDIDELEEWKGTASSQISTLEGTVATQGQTIAGHTTSIGENAAAITGLDGRLDTAEGKITALGTTVGDANSGLVKDVADLKTADTEIRELISDNTDAIDAVDGKVDAVSARVTETETNIGTISGKVDDLEDIVGDADSGLVKDVADLKSKDTELAGKITAIETKNGTQDTAISNNTKAIEALDTRVGTAEAAITTLNGDENVVGSVDAKIKAAKDALSAEIDADIIAANAMRFIDATEVALPTTVTVSDELQTGDTYVASTGFIQGSVPVNPGDLLIASGNEDPATGYINGAVTWKIVDTGYNDSHENKIVADAANSAVKLQSYLGSDLASVAFAAEGAARVAVTGTGNASTVTVSVVWDDFT